jgi:hypothetical protein
VGSINVSESNNVCIHQILSVDMTEPAAVEAKIYHGFLSWEHDDLRSRTEPAMDVLSAMQVAYYRHKACGKPIRLSFVFRDKHDCKWPDAVYLGEVFECNRCYPKEDEWCDCPPSS